jgi:hypothetical protein
VSPDESGEVKVKVKVKVEVKVKVKARSDGGSSEEVEGYSNPSKLADLNTFAQINN